MFDATNVRTGSWQAQSHAGETKWWGTGAVDKLQEALDGDWLGTEDGREAIAQLLVALKIQQNNIE